MLLLLCLQICEYAEKILNDSNAMKSPAEIEAKLCTSKDAVVLATRLHLLVLLAQVVHLSVFD